MIVFVHRATYIRVIRLESMGKPTDNIGKIFRTTIGASAGITGRTEWMWDGCYRNIEALNGSEKRQIIGLLDDLNDVRYRPQADMRTRWDQVIGHLV